jgi:DNA-binding MarR family transcriptional regulator
MDHLDLIYRRYASTKECRNLDVCRKPELKILAILGKNGPSIMTDLAERAELSVSTVTSIMDGLVEKSLVRRGRSEEDRRIVRVDLTRQGRKIYGEILEFQVGIVRLMLNALNKQEQELFVGLFRKIVRTIENKKKIEIV